MKYDSLLTDLKTQLPQAKNILIALPSNITIDKLAAGLSLMLGLKKLGKEVAVITDGTPLVGHSNLFGIGEVKNQFPSSQGGNFVISLEGVVEVNGQIPSLEKLDWYPEGSNLNLVFHVLPGQKFQPTNITHKVSGGGSFDLIFILGAANLNELGTTYSQNSQIFHNSPLINIDNNPQNLSYGKTNIVDPNSGSVSEIVTQFFPSLNIQMDPDIASNILMGVYQATNNMMSAKPDSFIVVGQAMQAGGKLPQVVPVTHQDQAFAQAFSQPQPQPQPVQTPPQMPQTSPQADILNQFQSQPFSNPQYDLKQVLQIPDIGTSENFVSPQVAPSQDLSQVGTTQKSYEERPTGEYTTTGSPEAGAEGSPSPDWLTPKIFKGGSLG